MKYLTESIDTCRQQCLATSMCRAPESCKNANLSSFFGRNFLC